MISPARPYAHVVYSESVQAWPPDARSSSRGPSSATESFPTVSRLRSAIVGGPALFGVLLLLILAQQGSSGFFATELARHPDEPAHFVTGVLVFDYLRSGFTQAPLAFAEQFYEQYPKVAFGHWPPMFYALQGIWYAAFGAQPLSLILLLGVVTALTAALLFWRTMRRHGAVIGSVTTALFLATPVVQYSTLIVGSDSLVTLLSFGAVLAFIDFMRLGRGRSLATFAIWALVGLLTKGTAIALALFALIAPVLARRTALFRSRTLWVTGAAISALIVPLYFGSLQLGQHGALSDLIRYSADPTARLFVLGQFANLTSLVVFAGAVLGVAVLVGRHWRSAAFDERRDDAAAALAWLIAVVGFQVLSPITGEPRYLLPAVVAVLLLFAEGLHALHEVLLTRWRRVPAALVPVGLGLLALSTQWSPLPLLTTGYANVARAIPTVGEAPVRVLISSNSQGEGAFVAERLVHDPARTTYVLRAYKVLVDDDWFGTAYRLKVETTSALRELLLKNAVGFVVVDDFGQPPGRAQAHHQLLHQTVAAYPNEFSLMGRFDVTVGSATIPGALLLYRHDADDLQSGDQSQSRGDTIAADSRVRR